ncbi:hypothetical protein AVEN_97939-1 [Araneus ventricosus]|uniref:Uncharacterized protein n=1 Tax=Araneus ventricosus TaxID=182803 RepID=A0A4Y2K0F4_ARAVE|nr:hypothetical protein AVEN_97939-1 [Araneus ventricosus]
MCSLGVRDGPVKGSRFQGGYNHDGVALVDPLPTTGHSSALEELHVLLVTGNDIHWSQSPNWFLKAPEFSLHPGTRVGRG